LSCFSDDGGYDRLGTARGKRWCMKNAPKLVYDNNGME
jgi:hypothetical protein